MKIDQTKTSKLVLFFTLLKQLCHLEEDIKCEIIYIPPYGSKYATDDPYLEIQSQLLRYCAESKQFLLLGDFSSRTGTMSDYMEVDEKIWEKIA